MTALNEEAARIADAAIIVRARFVEAADTEAHVGARLVWPADVRSLWPAVAPEPMDQVEMRTRYRPTAAAISRSNEVLHDWLARWCTDAERRILLGNWSRCIAVPHLAGSWRSFCKKSGRVRRTAERRLNDEFQRIATRLLQNSQSLQPPDWSRVSPLLPECDRYSARLDEVTAQPRHWLPDDARPADLPEQRDTRWAERQNQRNRKREANRRRQKAA